MSTTAAPPILPDKAYTRQEAAEALNLAHASLVKMAKQGRGPSYSRTGERGGRVIYMGTNLIAWVESRKVEPKKGS